MSIKELLRISSIVRTLNLEDYVSKILKVFYALLFLSGIYWIFSVIVDFIQVLGTWLRMYTFIIYIMYTYA